MAANAPSVEIDAQYRALREEAGLVVDPGRTLLAVEGSEGAEFLQGQLTNEIEGLEPGEGCYAALLDRKGKMRSDMSVLRLADGLIWIVVPTATADEVERHLTMYKVGREVEIERAAETFVVRLIGPRAIEILDNRPIGVPYSHDERRIAERDARAVAIDGGAELIAAGGEAAEAIAAELIAAGAERVSEDAAEIVRVEAGHPAFGRDMGNDTIPQEAGINDRAVSFSKGCYIGQETVARLHYRGKPNRHLRRLRAAEPLPEGAEVRVGAKPVGVVGTSVISPAGGPLALAILRREAEPGGSVEVGEGIQAEVEATA